MARRKVERDKTKIHPTFYRPREVKDFEDLNPDGLSALDSRELANEWGIVAMGPNAYALDLAAPTYIEIVSYLFHKSYTGDDVVDYTLEVPADPQTVQFDIRINPKATS